MIIEREQKTRKKDLYPLLQGQCRSTRIGQGSIPTSAGSMPARADDKDGQWERAGDRDNVVYLLLQEQWKSRWQEQGSSTVDPLPLKHYIYTVFINFP